MIFYERLLQTVGNTLIFAVPVLRSLDYDLHNCRGTGALLSHSSFPALESILVCTCSRPLKLNRSHRHLFPTIATASCCSGWLQAKNITLYIGNPFKTHQPLLDFLILGMQNKNSQASKTPWLYSQQHSLYLFVRLR